MTASRIGRYEILRPLGRGAMGIVYLALDPQIDRTIALKTIRFEDSGGSFNRDEAKARFLKEARISGRLQHPNIVTVYDVGEDAGTLYLAMEYVSGGSFAQKLGIPGALSMTDKVRIVAEVADALAHAHERGVIHRDIKPANIMLTEGLVAKVTDFGIGKLLSGDTELTSTGQMVGSPAYMSPEQIRGEKVDVRTDIFSLGVVLYQALTAKKPFPADTLTTLVYQILHEEPSDPVALQTDLPPAISAVMKACLAKKKDDRYADAAALSQDLREILGISPTASTGSLSESRVKRARAAAEVLPVTIQLQTIPRPAVSETGSVPPPLPPAVTKPVAAPVPAPVPAEAPGPLASKKAVPKDSASADTPGLALRIAAVVSSIAILGGVGYFAKKELGRPAEPPAQPSATVAEVPPLPTFAAPATKGETAEPGPTAVPVVQADPSTPVPKPSPAAPKATPRATPKVPVAPNASRGTADPSPAGDPAQPLKPTKTHPVAATPTKPPAAPTPQAHYSFVVRKSVKVNVSPSQARVFLDGRFIGVSDDWDDAGGGALVTFSSEGKHRFRFTYPGRKDLLIDVSCGSNAVDDKIELDQKMEKGEPGAPFGPEGRIPSPDYKTVGPVRFEVKPADAAVTLNGRLLGPATQFEDKDLTLPNQAVYDLVLSAPGYRSKAIRIISAPSTGKPVATVKESLKKE